MNRVHRNWLRPTPDYWQLWSYRDDERIAKAAPFVTDDGLPAPRVCQCCGCWYQPLSKRGAQSRYCKDAWCQKERHRTYWLRARDKRNGQLT